MPSNPYAHGRGIGAGACTECTLPEASGEKAIAHLDGLAAPVVAALRGTKGGGVRVPAGAVYESMETLGKFYADKSGGLLAMQRGDGTARKLLVRAGMGPVRAAAKALVAAVEEWMARVQVITRVLPLDRVACV